MMNFEVLLCIVVFVGIIDFVILVCVEFKVVFVVIEIKGNILCWVEKVFMCVVVKVWVYVDCNFVGVIVVMVGIVVVVGGVVWVIVRVIVC